MVLQAQTVNGTFVGLITDSSKAVVPGAQVEFIDMDRGLVSKATTGADGTYTAPYVLPGRYRVRATAPGFKAFEETGINLEIGTTLRVDATLEAGSVSDSVTVTGTATLLQTDRSEISRQIDGKAVTDLPRQGRNYQTTLLLIPGAGIPANYFTPENSYNSQSLNGNQDTQLNGTIVAANEYKMDGVLNKENVLSTTMVMPPPEAIGEVQVSTSNYDAGQGTVGGALVNVVTKSGTNEFHGSAAFFHTDSGMDARNFFAARMPRQNRDQYDATSPIRRTSTIRTARLAVPRSEAPRARMASGGSKSRENCSSDQTRALSLISPRYLGISSASRRRGLNNLWLPAALRRLSRMEIRLAGRIASPTGQVVSITEPHACGGTGVSRVASPPFTSPCAPSVTRLFPRSIPRSPD